LKKNGIFAPTRIAIPCRKLVGVKIPGLSGTMQLHCKQARK
jgi:hypothetical protein